MGFDVLYLPPFIHRPGESEKNNKKTPLEVFGSRGRWAKEGGHRRLIRSWETLRRFQATGDPAHLGLEVALDLAYQCASRPSAKDTAVVSYSPRRHRAICGESA
jgi:hypothetical protein